MTPAQAKSLEKVLSRLDMEGINALYNLAKGLNRVGDATPLDPSDFFHAIEQTFCYRLAEAYHPPHAKPSARFSGSC